MKNNKLTDKLTDILTRTELSPNFIDTITKLCQEEENRLKESKDFEIKTKTKLKDKGWIFSNMTFYHPHNGDEWTEQYFKSPRMNEKSSYDTLNDIHDIESHAVALSKYNEIKGRILSTILELLQVYYTKNEGSITAEPIVDIVFL